MYSLHKAHIFFFFFSQLDFITAKNEDSRSTQLRRSFRADMRPNLRLDFDWYSVCNYNQCLILKNSCDCSYTSLCMINERCIVTMNLKFLLPYAFAIPYSALYFTSNIQSPHFVESLCLLCIHNF